MTTEETNQLKVESAKKGLQIFIDNLVKTEEHVLFLQKRLEALSKKSKPTEDEKKQKTEMESNIKNYKEGIEDNKLHIEILRSLIDNTIANIAPKWGVHVCYSVKVTMPMDHAGSRFRSQRSCSAISPGRRNRLFSRDEDQGCVVSRGWLVAIITRECDIGEASPLQHEDQLMLAIIFDFLGMNFFLRQLPVPPQATSYLAGGDLLQRIHGNGSGRNFKLAAVGQRRAFRRFWPRLRECAPLLRQPRAPGRRIVPARAVIEREDAARPEMLVTAVHRLQGEAPFATQANDPTGKDRAIAPRQIKLVDSLVIEPGRVSCT